MVKRNYKKKQSSKTPRKNGVKQKPKKSKKKIKIYRECLKYDRPVSREEMLRDKKRLKKLKKIDSSNEVLNGFMNRLKQGGNVVEIVGRIIVNGKDVGSVKDL